MSNILLNKKSNKIGKCTVLWKYMLDIINSSQEIKRLTRYMTLNPLDIKGRTYDDLIVNQPNLNESLLIDCIEGEQVLYDSSFDPEKKDVGNLSYIFVYPSDIISKNGLVGKIMFNICVVCNYEFDGLISYGDKRIWKIAEYICDMFDDFTIDETDEIYDKVGNITFKIDNSIMPRRVAKTNTLNVIYIPISVEFISKRAL